MNHTLPEGDTEKTTHGTDMGALWRDDFNERLVRFNDFENFENYEVRVYTLEGSGEIHISTEYWEDETIEAFTDPDNEATAWLSGHNLPGNGQYGVFTSDDGPECPMCDKPMTPGSPDEHPLSERSVPLLGYTCEKYSYDHAGFMRQPVAIEEGYYITAEEYLQRRYGGEKA